MAASFSPRARAQSSFDTDPFSSRFRERPGFEIKFRSPEKGGNLRILVPEGDPPGRQSLIAENVYEVDAPPGKHVTVEYQDIRLTARKLRANYAARTLVAEGDVVLEQGVTRLTGSRLNLDLASQVGVVEDATLDAEGGFHLRAALLSKVGPRSFTILDGDLTACEGDRPAWRFHLKRGRVTVEEYARLSNVVFRFQGIPLLYTPYLVWPVVQERTSGLLVPGYGYSERRGLFLGLSYYWAFSRSGDATLSADVYSKKYFGFGSEVRLRPTEGTRIEGLGYVIRDPENESWRWKSRGSILADDLGEGLRGVMRWLLVSDQPFFQEFDRDFALTSARSIKSEAFLTRNSGPLSLNLRVDREEAFFGGQDEVVTERRPVLEARVRPTPLLGRAVYVEGESSAGLLRASRGAFQPSGTWDRLDVFPKVTAPLSPIPWLSLQAEAGFRFTSYGKSVSENGTQLVDERYNRAFWRAGAELTGPSFARIFEKGFGGYTRLKHVIEPRVSYAYVPRLDEAARAPVFDEVDGVPSVHRIRYALVQRLLGKGKAGAAREIASLEVSRSYSFDLLPGSTQEAGSPIDSALRVNVSSGLNLDARATYDVKGSKLTSSSVTAQLSGSQRTLSLSLFDNHPLAGPSSSQLRVSAGSPIVGRVLRLDLTASYDATKGKVLESRSLLTIQGSCWKILVEYRDLRVGATPNRDFRIGLNLKSIGSFLDFTGSL